MPARQLTRSAILSVLAASLALPLPAADTQEKLQALLQELQASREQEHEIASKMDRINAELSGLQDQSRQLVSEIRTLQGDVASLRKDIAAQDKALDQRQSELDARKEDIAHLLHGMIRLQRLPRHFVLAQPGDASSLLQTATALQVSYEASYAEAFKVVEAYRELKALRAENGAREETLKATIASLESKQSTLSDTVATRRALQRELQRDHASVKSRVGELSAQSNSLRELISRLESEVNLFRELGAPASKPSSPSRASAQFAARRGNLPYPASGRFLHRYGEQRGVDETYSGMVIQTAARAPVTAPYRGKVVFSGSFMDYGPMVIIQHDDAYHSVIAGMDVVEVEPGQPVNEEEMLGVMGNTPDTRKLYFELRKNSKAIDPTAWMGNLRQVASR